MTLVGSEEHAGVHPMMLTVQQHHHHRHHNLHLPGTTQIHRGNVIVSTGGNNLEGKMGTLQQQHQPQQSQQAPIHCKKSKMFNQAAPYNTVPHQPASVARRNARERNRVKQVNNGFQELRERIPQSVAQALGGNTAGTQGGARAGSKKLSKVETLRMAVEYIRSLQSLLEENDGVVSSTSSASSLLSIPGNSDGSGDLGHQQHHYKHHQRQNASPTGFAPAPCSEASSSPTPSFVSEASSVGSQGYGSSSSALYTLHSNNGAGEYYEPMTPEDEELLDVISMWQQNQ